MYQPVTTGRQRVGLALAAVLSIGNVVSIASPTPEGETGPPMLVLATCAVLGAVGLIGAIMAWRKPDRRVYRIVCGALILMALGAAPALFVDVPAGIKALVGATTLVTILACVLMLSPARRAAQVSVPS